MKCARFGFVIPLTLMLISIITILITALYQRGVLFVPFMSTMYKRQQARMLAMSGVQIAMSELVQSGEIEKKENEKKDTPPSTQPNKQLLPMAISQEGALFFSYLFPKMYQWQEFPLKKEIDGIDGTIRIILASEDGKINLNAIYDFVTKKFVGEGQLNGDWKKIMQQLLQRVQNKMGISANLFEGFEKFLKQRQYKVNDASELLTIDAFRSFTARQFYEPTSKESKEQPLYLLDLFTVYGYGKLQPWLLSDALRGALDMKRISSASSTGTQEMSQELQKKFKSNVTAPQDWNALMQPIYGIEFQRLPKGIEAVFETTFDPQLFSVVSYGIVGDITLRAYAILERVKRFAKQKTWYDIKIKKFYWI